MRRPGNEGFLLVSGLAPRDRRAILLGLLAIVPALAYVFGVRPFRTALAEAQDRVAAEEELLARELGLLETREELLESIRQAEVEAIRAEERLLQAPSSVLAEEELTELMVGVAYRNRVLLEEVRSGELARGEEAPPGLSLVRLHLRGESDLQGILSFLSEVEKGRLLLRVRGLALEPEVARSGPEDDGGPDALPTGVVTFQLILDGFARSEGGPDLQELVFSGPAE